MGLVKPSWPWFVELMKLFEFDKATPALLQQLGDMGLLLLPTAVITVGLFLLANFWVPRAKDGRFGKWRRSLMLRLIGLSWFFLCCAILVGLILFWVDSSGEKGLFDAPKPLVEFGGLVHAYYLDLLRG